jgi:hypothetical protein
MLPRSSSTKAGGCSDFNGSENELACGKLAEFGGARGGRGHGRGVYGPAVAAAEKILRRKLQLREVIPFRRDFERKVVDAVLL